MSIMPLAQDFGYQYKQKIEPSNPQENDIWLDMSGNNKWEYKIYYDGSWIVIITLDFP